MEVVAISEQGDCANFAGGSKRLGIRNPCEAAPELIESVEKEFARVRAELLSYLEQHG